LFENVPTQRADLGWDLEKIFKKVWERCGFGLLKEDRKGYRIRLSIPRSIRVTKTKRTPNGVLFVLVTRGGKV